MYTSECARFLSSLPSHPPPLTISRKSIKSMYTDAKSLSPVLLNHLFHGPVGFAWGMRYVAFATLGCFVVGNAMLHEPVKKVTRKTNTQRSDKVDGSVTTKAESVNTQSGDGAATPKSDGIASLKSDKLSIDGTRGEARVWKVSAQQGGSPEHRDERA
jgi:hypothetical protein